MASGVAANKDSIGTGSAASNLSAMQLQPPRAHAAQERHHVLILAGMAAHFTSAARSSTLPIENAVIGSDHRSARVITDLLDDEKCRLRLYDNRTGNLAAPDQPCRNMIEFDSSAVQPPAATIRRLDGISKWFSSR